MIIVNSPVENETVVKLLWYFFKKQMRNYIFFASIGIKIAEKIEKSKCEIRWMYKKKKKKN